MTIIVVYDDDYDRIIAAMFGGHKRYDWYDWSAQSSSVRTLLYYPLVALTCTVTTDHSCVRHFNRQLFSFNMKDGCYCYPYSGSPSLCYIRSFHWPTIRYVADPVDWQIVKASLYEKQEFLALLLSSGNEAIHQLARRFTFRCSFY